MVFTGTNQQQDTRCSDKENKLMKQMKFGDCLNKRVDMSKVKLDVLRPWISRKITDILHIEDDVIVEFVYNQLEEDKYPCPKKMQIDMTGFLSGRYAPQFMGELWSLLLSAQESDSGIPAELIQQKKEEILKREEEQQRLTQEKKLMKQMKFEDCLNKRVDMSKVKLDVLRPWISKKITDILHIEDDVVVEFVYNQLEEDKYPCPKKMQINMTGFLNGRNARQFMGELWSLLLSAQESDIGIPAELIQQKKEESSQAR